MIKFFAGIKKNIKKNIIGQYLKYLVIGIISNVYSFIVFKVFFFLALPVDISSILGMLVGIFNTYILGRIYIKKVIVPHSNKRLFFFTSYYFFAIYLTSQSIRILGSYESINYNFAWLYCTIIASFFNFVFLNFITLKTTPSK